MPWEATYRAAHLAQITEGLRTAGDAVRTFFQNPQRVTIINKDGEPTVGENIRFFRGDKNHLQAIIRKDRASRYDQWLSVGDVIVKVNQVDVTSPTHAANLLSNIGELVIEKYPKNDDLFSEYERMEEQLKPAVVIYKESKDTPLKLTFKNDDTKAIISNVVKGPAGQLHVGDEVVSMKIKNGQWEHVQNSLDAARKLRDAEGFIHVLTRSTPTDYVHNDENVESSRPWP